jgi:hypothetical protein
LAYHSSCDPLELLLLARPVDWATRSSNPRVCWVNRYDWGYHCANPTRAARFFADVDSSSGWDEANKRQEERAAAGTYRRPKKDEDIERWERLGTYNGHNIFLVDAANGAEALKLLARFVSYPSLGCVRLSLTCLFQTLQAGDASGRQEVVVAFRKRRSDGGVRV